MKKIFISLLSLIIIFTFMFFNTYINVSYAETITLSQIVTKFNNCSTVQEYKESGTTFTASSSDNKLNITITADTDDVDETTLEYTLDGTILTSEFPDDVLSGGVVAIILVDCIGQLQGYSDGQLIETLMNADVENYTLENEGFEVKQLSGDNMQVKIDISKKMPLVEITEDDTYIQVSDLDDLKEFIIGDGSAQKSKGNIAFHKDGYDDEAVIFVGEKGNLTENTYKSILSVLEVMFEGKEVANYFEENYSNISVGNKEFDGFLVEVNPEKSNMEKVVLGEDDTYQFVRITIDKSIVNPTIGQDDDYDQDDDDKDKPHNNNNINKGIIQTTNILPQTGLNVTIIIALIISIIIVIAISIKLHTYKDVK